MAGSSKSPKRPNLIRHGDRWIAHIRIGGGPQQWRTYSTLAEAETWLAEMRRLRGTGRAVRWSNPTFADFARRWLDEDAALRVRPTTLDRYRSLVELHLVPAFGKRRLSQITSEDVALFIRDWVNGGPYFTQRERLAGRRLGRAEQTVIHGANTGSAIYRAAVRQNAAIANPFSGVPRPTIPHKERPWFSTAELARLFAQLDTKWLPLYATLAGTGLRWSELAGLRWGDLDLDQRRLIVARRMARDGTVDAPKSARSRRTVPIPNTVANQLRQHFLRSRHKGATDLVFCTATGRPLSDSNMRQRVLRPALEAAGLSNVGHHALRHAFVANSIAAGTPISYVSRIVGHSSIAMTMDKYGHLVLDVLDEAGSRIDDFIFGEGWNNGRLLETEPAVLHSIRPET